MVEYHRGADLLTCIVEEKLYHGARLNLAALPSFKAPIEASQYYTSLYSKPLVNGRLWMIPE